jgi:hypothetical protein
MEKPDHYNPRNIEYSFLPSVHRKYNPDLRIHGLTIDETNDGRRPDATEPGIESKTEREIQWRHFGKIMIVRQVIQSVNLVTTKRTTVWERKFGSVAIQHVQSSRRKKS